MREIRPAPVDEIGIPLPIIPSENFTSYDKHGPRINKHHEFFLAGPYKFRSLGACAMRMSRLTRAEKEVHNDGSKSFHRFYNHSEGATNEQDQFNLTVLSIAGYLPKNGIDLWSGAPHIREIEDGEREILEAIDPNNNFYQNRIYHIDTIRPFFQKYIKNQDLSHIDYGVAEEFLSTPKISDVRDLGHLILRGSIETAVEPMRWSYQTALEAGQLHPAAPIEPEDIVLNALGNELLREKRMFPALRNNLQALPIAA
jgi:hypothetical protein